MKFRQQKVKILLNVECSAIKLTRKMTFITRRDAGGELLAAQSVKKESIGRCYHGSIVCEGLSFSCSSSGHMTRMHGDASKLSQSALKDVHGRKYFAKL